MRQLIIITKNETTPINPTSTLTSNNNICIHNNLIKNITLYREFDTSILMSRLHQ